MYDDDLFKLQRAWADTALTTTRQLLPTMAPVTSFPGWQADERRTMFYLTTATARATESTMLLCAYGQLWDAEVVLRSVLEGTLKMAHMLQSPETFPTRHREYAHDLFDVGCLKDHRKALDLLAAVPNPDAPEWRAMKDLVLPPQEVDRISARLDKAARRELDTRWGFAALVAALARSGDPYFKGLGAMSHPYAMASHVQHADIIGASIPLERDTRSPERRDAIHLAHLGRLLSDALQFLFVRLAVGYRFIGAQPSLLQAISATIEETCRPFNEAAEKWSAVEYGDPPRPPGTRYSGDVPADGDRDGR